jgi:hypothetical protein
MFTARLVTGHYAYNPVNEYYRDVAPIESILVCRSVGKHRRRGIYTHCYSPDTRWPLMADLWRRTGVQLACTIPSYKEPFHAQSM